MENNPHTFYIIYQLEDDTTIDNLKLEKGFYRYIYDLSGIDVPYACQFSRDRYEWSDCDIFKGLGEFQDAFEKLHETVMKFEREDYIETIHYKGMSIPIFNDDYGQCFYGIMDNKIISFGSFNPNYEDEVKSIIDHQMVNTIDVRQENNTQGT